MKKVLSLSILLLSMYSEVAYGIVVRGSRVAQNTPPTSQNETPVTPRGGAGSGASTVTTASALAAAGVTLDDVAAALEDMGADASKSKNKAAAESFIKTGSATMSSSNKSHKLGRLGNKK